MRLFYCLFFSIIFFTTQAQNYSSAQTLEDLDFLADNIKKYNAGLVRFNPQFDSSFQKIRAEVKGDLKALENFKLMAKVAALSKEGHMSLGNWTDTIHNGFQQDRYRYLPFLVRIINNEIYIWKVYSEEQEMNDGDKIISINGKASSEILTELRSFMFIDGDIQSNFHHLMNNGFAWMYYLYLDQSAQFEIEYTAPSEDDSRITKMKALTKSAMRKNYKIQYGINEEREKELGNEVFYFKADTNQATLKLKTFNRAKLKNQKVKAKKFYKTIFTELKTKKTKNLIIDLRGNSGGRIEMASEMLPYIHKIDSLIVYRTSISWKGKTKEFELPEKSELAFNGKIYVLVDGLTFSAAASLARYLKEYSGAVIIGEEGGGRYEGFVAGSKEIIELPNSKLKVEIPRYATIFPSSTLQQTKDRGIMPDHIVNYSLDDYQNQKDLVLEKLDSILTNP